METNTQNTTEIVATQTVAVTTTKTSGTTKLGRKPTPIKEILNVEFCIKDLEQLNSNVKAPTVRAFVARQIKTNRYILVGTQKSGQRGKPRSKYRIAV